MVGYENAITYQIANWPEAAIVRNTGTRVTIYIPQFPTYIVPPSGFETLSSGMITHEIITGTTSVFVHSGVRTLTINGRTASYSGTFFDASNAKSDEDIQVMRFSFRVKVLMKT